MNRLREFYETEVVDAMTKKFSYKNKMAVPKIEKVVINMGVGEARDNAKVLDGAVKDLSLIHIWLNFSMAKHRRDDVNSNKYK